MSLKIVVTRKTNFKHFNNNEKVRAYSLGYRGWEEAGLDFQSSLLIERSPKRTYWVHFAVRPKDNRRKFAFMRGRRCFYFLFLLIVSDIIRIFAAV